MYRACDVKPVNHLVYKDEAFCGGLTSKQNNNWISHLVWTVISTHALSYVEECRILSKIRLSHSEKSPARPMLFYSTNY